MKKTKQYPELKSPLKSDDLPATQGMLKLVRSELKSDVKEFRSDMNSRFNQVDARFDQVDARFKQIDARFNQVDSQFHEVRADINKVMQAVHHLTGEVSRLGVLVEEQNSRNRIVLEAITGLSQRDDRIEARVDDVERTVRSVALHAQGNKAPTKQVP